MSSAAGKKDMTQDSTGKLNCWEFKKCERQPRGRNAGKLGVCPASTCQDLDGVYGGKNAGRACWVVAGTLCGGKAQGTFAKKLQNCWKCDFMTSVKSDEEASASGFPYTRLGMLKTLEKKNADKLRPKSLRK